MKRFKEAVYNLIREDDKNNTASNIFDGIIISLIIINVVTVIADTFAIPETIKIVFSYIELVSVIIFTAEYIMRLWTSDFIYTNLNPLKARVKYILSFMALIDLFAILPFYIPFILPIDLRVLRMLRIVRLFRVFKVNRYTHALSTIGNIFKRKKSQLFSSIFIVFLLMIVAAVMMYNVETEAQPEAFSNAFDALWWAVATLTTVGYGDIYPVTVIGKILSGAIALLGIGLVAVPTGIISAGFMEQIEEEKANPVDKKNFCPYCGHKID